MLRVNLVLRDENLGENPYFIDNENVIEAETWPPLLGSDYEGLTWIGAEVNFRTRVLPLVPIGGVHHVLQLYKIRARPMPTDVHTTDCEIVTG